MSINPPSSQNGTLADRLNRRRRLRVKNGLDRTALDESDLTSLMSRPTTTIRPVDQASSQRTNRQSSFTSLGSSTPVLNRDNTPAKDTHMKQKYLFTDNDADFTPLAEQPTRSQSLEPIRERQSFARSTSIAEQQTHPEGAQEPTISKEFVSPVIVDEPLPPAVAKETIPLVSVKEAVPSVVTNEPLPQAAAKETISLVAVKEAVPAVVDNGPVPSAVIEKTAPAVTLSKVVDLTPPAQQKKYDDPDAYHDEEPVMVMGKISSPKLPPVISPRTKKTYQTIEPEVGAKSHSYDEVELLSPKLPPLVAPRATRKPKLSQPVARELPMLDRISDLSRTSLDCPSSDPQQMMYSEQKHFDFPATQAKPIARASSEQLLSANRSRHQPISARFAKQNSLALSYVFSKRIIAAEFTSGSSLDEEQSRYKTAWD